MHAKWNTDLDQFIVRSPHTSAPEPLPVVRDTNPLCLCSHYALSCDGGGYIHLAPVTALLCFHHVGLQRWGKRNDIQSIIKGSGDAGAASDQVCNVQRVTLQNETQRWVKISSTESASSVCGCFPFFSVCKFCLRNVEGLGHSISTLSA